MNIIDATSDPKLWAPWFKDRATWSAWFAFLKALFALPLTKSELEVFRQCTGRRRPPRKAVNECWLVVGRRGGKSFVIALVAVFLAIFRDWRRYLAPGERGTIAIIATDRKQARVILRYVKALITRVPSLAPLITREEAEAIDLTNGITVEIHTASYRAVRGHTVIAALLDEVAYWRDERSANPDREILNALRPAMATVPGAMLLAISSPYSRRGILWDAYQNHFGQEGDPCLVWQAPSRVMNPTLPQALIDKALADDPASAAAEYLAEFRSDLESFLDLELIRSCVRADRRELAPLPNVNYRAFADPSGGRHDSFTLAIGHNEGERVIIDAVRARRPPFDPQSVVNEFAALAKNYGITTAVGDRYAGEWVSTAFQKSGIAYDPSPLSKSDIYVETLALFTRGAIELPDEPRLLTELSQLERRTGRGKDIIDHPPGGHDDVANSVCGVAYLLRPGQVESWTADDIVINHRNSGLHLYRPGSGWENLPLPGESNAEVVSCFEKYEGDDNNSRYSPWRMLW
jgi:hypothetical protein